MSRVYNQTSAPLAISTSRASSNTPRQLDLMHMDSDSIFLITLARSNFSDPSTPITPTSQSTLGSSTFTFSSPTALPRPSTYSLFVDQEEVLYREAPVWPTGLSYEDEDEDEYRPLNPYVATTPPGSSSRSYPRGQAVEVHHGTALITAWVKKAYKKVTPNRWRRLDDEALRGRMALD
ncbi:hypothetical protein FRC00_003793 [Tulasnella sp. 408]|nr:hypothetical protein FRC00_003793 [Tulasnella sp. 408]